MIIQPSLFDGAEATFILTPEEEQRIRELKVQQRMSFYNCKVAFGKYKNVCTWMQLQRLDPEYWKWLNSQDWFRERFGRFL